MLLLCCGGLLLCCFVCFIINISCVVKTIFTGIWLNAIKFIHMYPSISHRWERKRHTFLLSSATTNRLKWNFRIPLKKTYVLENFESNICTQWSHISFKFNPSLLMSTSSIWNKTRMCVQMFYYSNRWRLEKNRKRKRNISAYMAWSRNQNQIWW